MVQDTTVADDCVLWVPYPLAGPGLVHIKLLPAVLRAWAALSRARCKLLLTFL